MNIARLCIALAFISTTVHAESGMDLDGKNPKQSVVAGFNDCLLIPLPVSDDNAGAFAQLEIMTDKGEWVELQSISSSIDAHGYKDNRYSVVPGSTIRRTIRCPRRTSMLKEAYDLQNDAGGHFHTEIPSPPLSVSSPSVSDSTPTFHPLPSPLAWAIQGNTTYYYWEQFPAFATMVVEDFSSDLCGQWTDTIFVEIRGLNAMPGGKDYILYSSDDAKVNHPYNHYGHPALINTLKFVAREYVAAFPGTEPLQIGDMSLFSGGIFDIKHNWAAPHTGHNLGIDADIRKNTIPNGNRRKLLEILCLNIPATFIDLDLPDFYHVSLPTVGVATGDAYEKAVKCCAGNQIDPDNISACTAD